MVRHEAMARPNLQGRGSAAACCASPTGESPVPVGVGAPGSRPQACEGDLGARAGCQKPVRRRESRSGEQARGPQHEVKPAASTEGEGARASGSAGRQAPALQGQRRPDEVPAEPVTMQRTAVAETHAAIAGGEARRRGPTHSCVLCIGVGGRRPTHRRDRLLPRPLPASERKGVGNRCKGRRVQRGQRLLQLASGGARNLAPRCPTFT